MSPQCIYLTRPFKFLIYYYISHFPPKRMLQLWAPTTALSAPSYCCASLYDLYGKNLPNEKFINENFYCDNNNLKSYNF